MAPKSAELLTNLGMIKRVQGRPADAEAICREALEVNPNSPTAVVLLADLHADRAQFEEAEKLFSAPYPSNRNRLRPGQGSRACAR